MQLNDFFSWLLISLPEFSVALPLVLALLLDKYLGEARHYHYLVAFGWLADQCEKMLNLDSSTKASTKPQEEKLNKKSAFFGAISWLLLVLPLPLFYFFFLNDFPWYWQILLDACVLYLAIGLNSLHQHAMQVYQPLKANNLTQARHFTGYLVSRETQDLTPDEISRATVESMLENGHDSVIASMAYFVIGGAPLVILHRFANTLDAMWGYKTAKFYSFGFASARLDDLLGFLTGKICMLFYALQSKNLSQFTKALKNAMHQGNKYKSHNGGWVMATGATVMNIKLGGSASYHGKLIESTTLGCGNCITIEDIPNSVLLVKRAAKLLTIFVFLVTFFSIFYR